MISISVHSMPVPAPEQPAPESHLPHLIPVPPHVRRSCPRFRCRYRSRFSMYQRYHSETSPPEMYRHVFIIIRGNLFSHAPHHALHQLKKHSHFCKCLPISSLSGIIVISSLRQLNFPIFFQFFH